MKKNRIYDRLKTGYENNKDEIKRVKNDIKLLLSSMKYFILFAVIASLLFIAAIYLVQNQHISENVATIMILLAFVSIIVSFAIGIIKFLRFVVIEPLYAYFPKFGVWFDKRGKFHRFQEIFIPPHENKLTTNDIKETAINFTKYYNKHFFKEDLIIGKSMAKELSSEGKFLDFVLSIISGVFVAYVLDDLEFNLYQPVQNILNNLLTTDLILFLPFVLAYLFVVFERFRYRFITKRFYIYLSIAIELYE